MHNMQIFFTCQVTFMLNDDIIRLINKGTKDQNELLNELKALGYDITQSSISRKLKQLGVIKLHGKYQLLNRAKNTISETEIIPVPPNLLVIKTIPGHANVIASIIDDHLISSDSHFIATIAGDDTVFVAIDLKNQPITILIQKIKELL